MVGPWCVREAVFTKCQGKTATTAERERGTARALSGIMRRKSIRENTHTQKKTLVEREREGGKRVVRWVGDGENHKEMALI